MPSSLIIRNPIENNYAKYFCKRFINGDCPKYIFGINKLAESVIQHVKIDGFIDDYSKEKYHKGIPIIPIHDVPSNALVLSAVTQARPLTADRRLSKFQFEYIDYYSFIFNSGLNISNIIHFDGVISDIEKNYDKYMWIYDMLGDKESKNQFYNIINFRKSHDISYMQGFAPIMHKQYFEDFLDLGDKDVFVDVGGYDGFTSEEFSRKYPNYKSIHIFEPDANNFLTIKNRLINVRDINFYNSGLADKKEILKFSSNGSSSKISTTGEIEIFVDQLDNIINEKVTFVKMDIEGAEYSALVGSKNTIKKYHPKLAICVYHQANHIWKIPEFILNIRNDYDIFLRHYSEGNVETVMFFIPKK